MIDISNKNKARVLTARYNYALSFLPGNDMSEQETEALLENTASFDYIKGRVIKVNLSGDTLDPFLYDRDNGRGAAGWAVEGVGE